MRRFAGGNGRPRWLLVVSFALAVVLLVLAVRGVDWNAMLATARQGRLGYLVAAFAVLTISYFQRGMRWRVLLSAEKPVALSDAFWATCVGYLGNSFLPARAGELIRTVLIGQAANISKSYVLATALTERILDVPTLVLFTLLSIPFVGTLPDAIVAASRVLAVVSLAGVGVLFLAPRFQGLIIRLLGRLPLPGSLLERLLTLTEEFLLGMRAFQHVRRALAFAGLTITIWSTDVVVALLIANAFSLTLSAPQALLLLAALGLSSAIPSTPGYVGIYQFVAVTVLVPFGFTQDEALVYIIAFQLVTYVGVTIWGAVGLWRLGVSRRGLLDESEQPAGEV